MKSTSPLLLARARRAYEIGRLKFGLRRALGVAPVTVLSSACCSSPSQSLLLGAVLAAAVTYLGWQGRLARALVPGLVTGTSSYALVLLAANAYPGFFSSYCGAVCGICGFAAGLILTWFVAQRADSSRELILGAGVIAIGAAAVGCAPLGVAGLVGVAFGGTASVGLGALVMRAA